MSAAQDIFSATAENDNEAISLIRCHTSGTIIDTQTTFLSILRDSYPGYHVTEVGQSRIALIQYADHGKATASLDSSGEKFSSVREWKPVGDGIERRTHPGKLKDRHRFARFQYVWEEKDYIVYSMEWREPNMGSDQAYYILYPRSEDGANVRDGHCVETDELIAACGKWTNQLHKEIWVFDDGHWQKSTDLWNSVDGSSWDDVILDPEMKKNLIEDVQGFFDNRQIYSQFAVPWKRGIILHGWPGNGKTVSLKALMSALYQRPDNIPALYVKTLSNRCQTEQYSIKSIFMMARSMAPCLLIFEDLDSLISDGTRSYFLNEVDGLESNDGILMIGSTNHLDKLDPAIAKRPSRFDRKYHFKLPQEAERTLYAEYWRSKLLKNNTVEYPEEVCGLIAKLTDGFSFAYMKELFVMSLLSLAQGYKGEDFEFVDPSDAAGAAEKTSQPSTAQAPTLPTNEPELCTCNKKCDKCGKLFESQKKEEAATQATAELNKEAKISMLPVEIPEYLEDNLLLKVVKHHIRVLHSEMDTTKEEQWPSGKGNMGEGGGPSIGRYRRAYRRAVRMPL